MRSPSFGDDSCPVKCEVAQVESPQGFKKPLRRVGQDVEGATAVEFGLVATPFLSLLFGIMAVGLYFFTQAALEGAVAKAARYVRTGQAQTSGMTAAQFQQMVCDNSPSIVSCADVRVNVQSFPNFGAVVVPGCTDGGGNIVPPANTAYNPGASGTPVLVTVCYQMSLLGYIPFLSLKSLNNGDALLQVSSVFQNEPYAGNN